MSSPSSSLARGATKGRAALSLRPTTIGLTAGVLTKNLSSVVRWLAVKMLVPARPPNLLNSDVELACLSTFCGTVRGAESEAANQPH